MSHVSLNQLDVEADFWDYIACGKCSLPYSFDDPTSIPFWLTECGHVVCNNHITLDTIAFAAKFQQEMLAGQIRYYRNRYQQCRTFIEKMKQDVAQLRKANNTLAVENEQLKQAMNTSPDSGYHSVDYQEPAEYTNSNNKRPMMPATHQYTRDHEHPPTSSSPRSIPTPIGPSRITLPAGRQAPKLSSSAEKPQRTTPQSRPGSSRQLQDYAFVPPDTAQYEHHLSPLAKTQAAPRFFQRSNQAESSNSSANKLAASSGGTWLKREDSLQAQIPGVNSAQQASQLNSNGQQQSLSKFKPSLSGNAPPPTRGNGNRRQVMGPPPTPQRTRLPPAVPGFGQAQAVGKQPTSVPPHALRTPAVNRRFVPSSNLNSQGQGRPPQHTSQGNQSGRPVPGMGGSGQRMPFVPGGSM